jgi:hypothetical protein
LIYFSHSALSGFGGERETRNASNKIARHALEVAAIEEWKLIRSRSAAEMYARFMLLCKHQQQLQQLRHSITSSPAPFAQLTRSDAFVYLF